MTRTFGGANNMHPLSGGHKRERSVHFLNIVETDRVFRAKVKVINLKNTLNKLNLCIKEKLSKNEM